jgi:cytosine/creatinine deaminase
MGRKTTPKNPEFFFASPCFSIENLQRYTVFVSSFCTERPFVTDLDLYRKMLAVALEEARQGHAEGGIPIGAALFTRTGELLSCGHNRRIQEGDPSIHGETDAFRRAGRQRSYRNLVMVTTLAPCWYCSGLVRQFRIGTLVVGESRNFPGGLGWLRENGVDVIDLDDTECRELLAGYIAAHPEIWNEDIGEE